MFHKMAVLSSLDKSWTFVMLVFFLGGTVR